MFGVGDTVVCINDSIQSNMFDEVSKDFKQWVVKDKKYIIRGLHDNDGIVTGVLLEEVVNPPIYFRLLGKVQEPAFGTFRFRKLASVNSSISINKEEEIEV